MERVRFYSNVLETETYIKRPLVNESLVEHISKEAIVECRKKGTRLPDDALVDVQIKGAYIMVEIYALMEAPVPCMPEQLSGIYTH